MVSIIIPTLNEEKNIINLINEINKFLNKYKIKIYIIDGNSTDNTVKKIKTLKKNNVDVMVAPKRKKNIPHNCRDIHLGLKKAYLKEKSEYFVIFDGDGSYHPKQIIKMLKIISDKKCGFVLASKNLKYSKIKRSYFRILVSKFYHLTSLIILNRKLTSDYSSAYRCYNRKSVSLLIKKRIKFVGAVQHLEDFLYLKTKKIDHEELPMIYRERAHGKSSVRLPLYIFYLFELFKCLFNYRKKLI